MTEISFALKCSKDVNKYGEGTYYAYLFHYSKETKESFHCSFKISAADYTKIKHLKKVTISQLVELGVRAADLTELERQGRLEEIEQELTKLVDKFLSLVKEKEELMNENSSR